MSLKQIRDRKNRHTVGTYRYKESHGEGLPGLKEYISHRTRALIKQRGIVVKKLEQAAMEVARLEENLNAKR